MKGIFRWLWKIEWYRRMRRRQRLRAGETIVFGVAYSDLMPIPIPGDTIDLRLPVKVSPIYPNGTPKSSNQLDKRDQYSLIRRIVTYFHTIRDEKSGEWAQLRLFVRPYWIHSTRYPRYYMSTPHQLACADVIAICYDRSEPESFHNAIYKWYPRVLQFSTGAPICLIGCHYPTNLQRVTKTEDAHLISTKEGENAARQIGAVTYIEWTEGKDYPLGAMKALMWYGYYYHLDKPFSVAEFWGP